METKKNNKKKIPSAEKGHAAKKPAGLVRQIGLPVFWVAVMATGLWALMHFSAPSGDLVPYEKYEQLKKTSVSSAAEKSEAVKDSPPSLDENSVSEEHNNNASELIKQASPVQPPKSTLPKEALEHISKGMGLTEQGKFNQADMEFEKAARISPDSPELYSIWGAALKMQKKFKGADRKFARAHELAPNDGEIVFNWALSALEQRDSAEAIRLFTKAVKLEPGNYFAHNYLGKAYGQEKRYDEEIASYKKAIEINPQFAQAEFNLGVVLSIQKKFEEAAPHFEKAIAIDKDFEKPFVVQLLTALGRYTPGSPKPEKTAAPEAEAKPEPVQEAKADPKPEPKVEEKQSEGSDHKMEGSKNVKETTNLKGKVLVNGKPLSRPGLVFLETKTKLKIPEQKTFDLTIRQGNLQFLPQHSIIFVGSSVTFSNEDREVHNIYSKSQRNQFNLGAMAAGSSRTLTFDQPGPIVLRCNMHKDMIGTLFVVPNGYYTQPDANGEYAFAGVKSQGYLLTFWHPQLSPEEVAANMKQVDLKGVDQSADFDIQSASRPGEIHDMVDPTDYRAIVDNIEREMFQAIEDWKQGKKSIPKKRMLMAITKHYDGEGLKGAIAKSFSAKRSLSLEKKLDDIRKDISGIGVSKGEVTEQSLKSKAEFVVSQLRNNVQELEARLNPDFNKQAAPE